MKTKTEYGVKVGLCGVDSGQIMFSDPCYVKQFKESDNLNLVEGQNEMDYPYSYEGACNASLSKKHAGQLGNGTGVCVSSGYGDGVYPVYVNYSEDGRVASATIVFISDETDNSDDYDDEDEEY